MLIVKVTPLIWSMFNLLGKVSCLIHLIQCTGSKLSSPRPGNFAIIQLGNIGEKWKQELLTKSLIF